MRSGLLTKFFQRGELIARRRLIVTGGLDDDGQRQFCGGNGSSVQIAAIWQSGNRRLLQATAVRGDGQKYGYRGQFGKKQFHPGGDSPADGALVAGMAGLVALGGGAGQRGVPVHTEGVVLAALLPAATSSAAEQVSAKKKETNKNRNCRERQAQSFIQNFS